MSIYLQHLDNKIAESPEPMKIIRIILINILLLLLASSAFAWTVKVVGVTDGDTIKVLHDGKQVKVRLYGIDTPERKQAYGKQATKFTVDMVAEAMVDVEEFDVDRYGRTVGVVTIGDKNLNEELIKAGLAWVYRKYCDSPFCSDWLAWQRRAKSLNLGLWKEKEPIAPWEWRRQNFKHYR